MSELRDKLELLQVSSLNKDLDCFVDYPGLSRTSPDGQAEAEHSVENIAIINCDQGVNVKSVQ